jgi:hypothetical protein
MDPFTLGLLILAGIVGLSILQQLMMTVMFSFGPRSVIKFLLIPGIFIHETSHLIMCVLFGHKVTGFSVFTEHGMNELGYVSHAYRTNSLIQVVGNFPIGIAPLFGGLIAMWYMLHSNDATINSISAMIESIQTPTETFELWVNAMVNNFPINVLVFYGVIVTCVTMCPSKTDFQNCIPSLFLIIVITSGIAFLWNSKEMDEMLTMVLSFSLNMIFLSVYATFGVLVILLAAKVCTGFLK